MTQPERERANKAVVSPDLARARACYARRAWKEAHDSLSAIDRAAAGDEPTLSVEDLERLAMCAGMIGRDDAFLKGLERTYEAALLAGDHQRAMRAAFWSFMRFQAMRESGRASGWLTRCQRLVEGEGGDNVGQGYLLIPLVMKSFMSGELTVACEKAEQAAAIADRFGDADVLAFARNMQGRSLVRLGKVREGIALLDENMLTATTGPSPLITALIYCGVISSCYEVHAFERAREWTNALSDWCEAQPELVAFRGTCMVHRAEVLRMGGDWSQAFEQAKRAATGVSGMQQPDAVGEAYYEIGEIHRVRGDVEAAELAYRTASQHGTEPQPGLALLRLALGQRDAAASGIRRVLAEARSPISRTKLLPAAVEILLAVDAVEEARAACRELEETASRFETEALGALAAHARATVHLYEDDAQAALGPLRRAFWVWQKIGAPHAAARLRVDLSRACEALGDHEGAKLELDAARAAFAELGAALDLAALDAPQPGPTAGAAHGLTQRELQVLRLVATGKTNKSIASELFLSEKTIDRHVSNIFTKVRVSSRAAATAFAYEHRLI